jgi:predicted enzyme related to lactoylglutathione lyase
MRSLRATIMADTMEIPGIGTMAVLQDPTGAVINLFKGSGHPGAAKLDLSEGAVQWNELSTRDTEAASAFYSGLFGWEAQTGPVPGTEGMIYTTFMQGETPVAGMMAIGDDEAYQDIPPHWMPYLTVTDCAKSAASVEGLGGSVRVPPQTVPGVGTFSVIADPTGAHCSLMQWDMGSE